MKKFYYKVENNDTNLYQNCKYVVFLYDYDYDMYSSYRRYYFEDLPSVKAIRDRIIYDLCIFNFKISRKW